MMDTINTHHYTICHSKNVCLQYGCCAPPQWKWSIIRHCWTPTLLSEQFSDNLGLAQACPKYTLFVRDLTWQASIAHAQLARVRTWPVKVVNILQSELATMNQYTCIMALLWKFVCIQPRVYNKQEKRVLNVLYAPWKMFWESHAPGIQTWECMIQIHNYGCVLECRTQTQPKCQRITIQNERSWRIYHKTYEKRLYTSEKKSI